VTEGTFDFVIIGAGAAGEAAAHYARARGASVAIVDRDLFGGSCPFWACMPSKTLLHAAEVRAHGGRQVGLARSRRIGGFGRCGHVIDSRHGGAPYVGITRTGSAVDGASRPLSPVRPSSRVYVVSACSVARVP